ncbi:NUDIX hydrolase [Ornithinibacillus salinisoli]|uniref:NUDIX hydrolase n=1 Tax=Ornithinibacillus salinisoli TaxID=1848459 RepID=A0ABW4VWL5_9BACI
MKEWYGAAGVCVNENNEILMVKQGTPEEEKTWSVPSGGKENGETFEACCIREVNEETGYHVNIIRLLFAKKSTSDGYHTEVQYFEVQAYGGEAEIQDPDNLIYEIGWKSVEDITNLELTYPGDREILIDFIESKKDLEAHHDWERYIK